MADQLFIFGKKDTGGKKDFLVLPINQEGPHNTRKMYVHPIIYHFIKSLRDQYPRLGKEKIKILLDEYRDEANLEPVSTAKIGRIMKRNNWFFYLGKRTKRGARPNKKQVFGYEIKKPGDLVRVDTVVCKFSFAFTYKRISLKQTADFAQKLLQVTPYPVSAVQMDNGSEFLKTFDRVLARDGMVHFFTYPRCPKQNGVVERFNRTIQEEFAESQADLLCHLDPTVFNNLLMDYLLFDNLKRPHHSLGLKTPMQMVVEYLKESSRC